MSHEDSREESSHEKILILSFFYFVNPLSDLTSQRLSDNVSRKFHVGGSDGPQMDAVEKW